jgi:hypothetical protein
VLSLGHTVLTEQPGILILTRVATALCVRILAQRVCFAREASEGKIGP